MMITYFNLTNVVQPSARLMNDKQIIQIYNWCLNKIKKKEAHRL